MADLAAADDPEEVLDKVVVSVPVQETGDLLDITRCLSSWNSPLPPDSVSVSILNSDFLGATVLALARLRLPPDELGSVVK